MMIKKMIITFSCFGKLRLNRKLHKFILIEEALRQGIFNEDKLNKLMESHGKGIYNDVIIEKVEKIKVWEFWK